MKISHRDHNPQATKIWSFHVAVLQETAKKCTKTYNARPQPLFCSLNLLFSEVPLMLLSCIS